MRSPTRDVDYQSQVRKLIDACLRGDQTLVEKLFQSGLAVDANDDDDVTPLQAAAAGGQLHLVEYLLNKGGDFELCNQTGLTPLLHSCFHGHHDVFRLLIQRGANPHTYSYLGASSLTLASRGGHLQLLKTLLSFGLDVNPSACGADMEFTPLMAAVVNNQEYACRFLISRGADVQASIRCTGFTVLMLAAIYSSAAIVQILLDGGADPNTFNLQGKTALDLASKAGRREIQTLLQPRTTRKKSTAPPEPPLTVIEAVKQGKSVRLREILDNDPSQGNTISVEEGSSPLIYASMIGRMDYVTLLVKCGADLNQRDKFGGWTALMQAIFYGKTNIAKYLINAGADVNIKAYGGYTAFDLATTVESSDKELLTSLANRSVNEDDNRVGAASLGRNTLNKLMKFRKANRRVPHNSWWKKVASRLKLIRLNRNTEVDPLPSKTPFALSWGPENNLFVDPVKSLSNDENMFFTCEDILHSTHSLTTNAFNRSAKTHVDQSDSTRKFAVGITALLYPGSIPIIPPLHRPSGLSDNDDSQCDEQIQNSSASELSPMNNDNDGYVTSVATINAELLGPGKPKKLQPVPTRAKRKPPSSTVTFSSSNGIKRIRRPSPLTFGNVGVIGFNPYPSLLRSKPNDRSKRSPRPYSYHDVIPECRRLAPPIVSSGLGTLPRRRPATKGLGPSNNNSRPHSYHDPVSPTGKFGSGDLPVTPTRRSFGFFHQPSTTSSSSLERFSSTPLLHCGSPSQSFGGVCQRRQSNFTSTLPPHCSLRSIENDLPEMEEEELEVILKKLSLESYYSIFEEQEVDMETFLTLTDSDLRELGIEDVKSRNQILAAARKLNRNLRSRYSKASSEVA